MSEEIVNPDDEIIVQEEEVIEPIVEEVVVELSPEEIEAQRLAAEQEAADKLRLAEIARQESIQARKDALFDFLGATQQLGISNGDLYFEQRIKFEKDHNLAEVRLKAIEDKDNELRIIVANNEWIEGRRKEYKKIDVLLMEAIAEKEAGNPEKMQQYLQLREDIKNKFPKPVVE